MFGVVILIPICLFCCFFRNYEMVISVPVVVQFFVKRDEFIKERFALGIRVKLGVFREKTQAEMQFTHTVGDVKVFDIERLDILRKTVVVSALAGFKIISRVVLLELRPGFNDGIHLLLHGINLFMLLNFKPCFKKLPELAFDKFSLSLWVKADVAVHDRVVGELEEKDGAFFPILFLFWGIEEILKFEGEIFVHGNENLKIERLKD